MTFNIIFGYALGYSFFGLLFMFAIQLMAMLVNEDQGNDMTTKQLAVVFIVWPALVILVMVVIVGAIVEFIYELTKRFNTND